MSTTVITILISAHFLLCVYRFISFRLGQKLIRSLPGTERKIETFSYHAWCNLGLDLYHLYFSSRSKSIIVLLGAARKQYIGLEKK
jgi:hypothetical protein